MDHYTVLIIIAIVISLIAGIIAGKFIFAKDTRKQLEEADLKAQSIIKEAELREETIKKEKQLEAKEKFVQVTGRA